MHLQSFPQKYTQLVSYLLLMIVKRLKFLSRTYAVQSI